MTSDKVTDIEDVVKTWTADYVQKFSDKDVRKLADLDDILSTDINLKRLRVVHEKPRYKTEGPCGELPSGYVLFKTSFTNNTEKEQENILKTERRTRSSCSISIEKGFTIGGSIGVNLSPPNPVIQANAGFSRELSLNRMEEHTLEEELVWTVDTKITIPPQTETTAELIIKEEEYNGHFVVETKFEGQIQVTVRNKKDRNNVLTIITGNVNDILTPQYGFYTKSDNKKLVCFATEGMCRCRYGIQQTVTLKQKALDLEKS
uniref:Uncharacterized protein LOC100371059 n=1 Tax=Saccoglossus kowalevskii TaxID=10224 RepID=A0ABM0GPZ8_SACKO|nr:PREDICTED: uncharacterized protein LOC100371059 [Saccoglossus kowalevskii]